MVIMALETTVTFQVTIKFVRTFYTFLVAILNFSDQIGYSLSLFFSLSVLGVVSILCIRPSVCTSVCHSVRLVFVRCTSDFSTSDFVLHILYSVLCNSDLSRPTSDFVVYAYFVTYFVLCTPDFALYTSHFRF